MINAIAGWKTELYVPNHISWEFETINQIRSSVCCLMLNKFCMQQNYLKFCKFDHSCSIGFHKEAFLLRNPQYTQNASIHSNNTTAILDTLYTPCDTGSTRTCNDIHNRFNRNLFRKVPDEKVNHKIQINSRLI